MILKEKDSCPIKQQRNLARLNGLQLSRLDLGMSDWRFGTGGRGLHRLALTGD